MLPRVFPLVIAALLISANPAQAELPAAAQFAAAPPPANWEVRAELASREGSSTATASPGSAEGPAASPATAQRAAEPPPTTQAAAAPPALVPRPAEYAPAAGVYEFGVDSQIHFQHDNTPVREVAEYLADRLAEQIGWRPLTKELPAGPGGLPRGSILVALGPDQAALGDEGYLVGVSDYGVMLAGYTPTGLFRGVQTIRQMLRRNEEGKWQLPAARVRDMPRYRWRGMLLDCGRHFMPKEFVKRYIDLLAYHKMNVLHWHLTEDQGWRIEIRKYPKLTEVGAWRRVTRDSELPGFADAATARAADGLLPAPPIPRPLTAERAAAMTAEKARYGGFYTQADVREIVAYAQSRHITVVPEIEMPGHSLAALAAYPELSCTGGPFEVGVDWGVYDDVYCAGSDRVFEFLQDVLTEVMELFPSTYIHIGGDECPKARWKTCPKCQERIRAEGLKDEHELQSYFIRRIEKFLSAKGRRLVGWDEILEGGLAPNATVQSWRGLAGAIAAARSGHDVISSPTSHCYLDYPQWSNPGEPQFFFVTTLGRSYTFEPTPLELTETQRRHVLGLEGNMWTERAPRPRVDWQVFPRLCALAEVGWSPAEARLWGDFERRMETHLGRLDALGVAYFIPSPLPASSETTFQDRIEVAFQSPPRGGVIHYTLDGAEPTKSSSVYREPIVLSQSTTVRARTVLPDGRSSEIVTLAYRRLWPMDGVAALGAAAGLRFSVYEGHWHELPSFAALRPVAAGTTSTISPAPADREKDFAIVFEGLISVPADGLYTFYLKSDDGSRLVIHDEVVADNDGLHAVAEKSGRVMLRAGHHPIRIEYFQGDGAQVLELTWQPDGGQRVPVPQEALHHVP